MKTITALNIATKVAELTGLCTTFQAKFGKRFEFTSDSPAEAFALHRAIADKQAEIAQLLDHEALIEPAKQPSEWWRWHDAMNIATAGDLAQHANRLISSCAYREAGLHESDSAHAVFAAQVAIAGLLHPNARQKALDALATPA
jgi:hypothetical protein